MSQFFAVLAVALAVLIAWAILAALAWALIHGAENINRNHK